MNDSFPVSFELSLRWRQLLIAVTALLLILMAFYPPGYDQSVFAVGGDRLLHGAIPYRDFLDTKPPAIFYIYAFAQVVFGHHMWGYRVIDVLYYFIASFYFYRFLILGKLNRDLALFSVFVLVTHYVSNGFWMTAQAESFAILPALGITTITLKRLHGERRSLVADAIIIGTLTMLLFLLKFTLVIAAAAALLYLLIFDGDRKRSALLIAGSFAFFAILLAGFLYSLNALGAFDPFFQGIAWVQKYADIDPPFAKATISKLYYQFFPTQFFFFVSPLFFVAMLASIFKFFRNRARGHLFPLLLFQLTAGLLMVLYERKFFGYHFTRIDWTISPFIALGLIMLTRLLLDLWHRTAERPKLQEYFLRSAWVMVVLLMLFYSPYARMMNQSFRWVILQMTGGSVAEEVQTRDNQFYFAEQVQTGEWLKNHLTADQQFFFWGNGVAIYWYAEKPPTTIVLTNTPFITTWTPTVWKTRALEQLRTQQPSYLVVEWGDAREYITGNDRDSYENMVRWGDLNAFRLAHYREVHRIGHYIIYQHRDLSAQKVTPAPLS